VRLRIRLRIRSAPADSPPGVFDLAWIEEGLMSEHPLSGPSSRVPSALVGAAMLGATLPSPATVRVIGTEESLLQNLSLSFSPVWHSAVLVRYDLGVEQVVLRTGLQEAEEQSIHVFERTWVRGGS
jgi:hypothetical protein